ncbi:hypothetical protein JKP88DRAFT_351290 [Tribonema minus]|uniref:Uncharacterized protein n=1 Tax=Tribonema minus TaxID=303371 RepID=A0A835YSW3_9STRA|nr:hypothetical protein JKP88DRAFT_351290 [Tribonema minus]
MAELLHDLKDKMKGALHHGKEQATTKGAELQEKAAPAFERATEKAKALTSKKSGATTGEAGDTVTSGETATEGTTTTSGGLTEALAGGTVGGYAATGKTPVSPPPESRREFVGGEGGANNDARVWEPVTGEQTREIGTDTSLVRDTEAVAGERSGGISGGGGGGGDSSVGETVTLNSGAKAFVPRIFGNLQRSEQQQQGGDSSSAQQSRDIDFGAAAADAPTREYESSHGYLESSDIVSGGASASQLDRSAVGATPPQQLEPSAYAEPSSTTATSGSAHEPRPYGDYGLVSSAGGGGGGGGGAGGFFASPDASSSTPQGGAGGSASLFGNSNQASSFGSLRPSSPVPLGDLGRQEDRLQGSAQSYGGGSGSGAPQSESAAVREAAEQGHIAAAKADALVQAE